ncbi:hypothetical protein GGF43_001368, partial [Coemansia sp. RSA 2618]
MGSPDQHAAMLFAGLDLSSSDDDTAHRIAKTSTRRERTQRHQMEKHRKNAYATFMRLENLDSVTHIFDTQPRKTLCIVNLGLGAVGGATTEQLERVFSPFAGFERVVMKHDKPYSFARFRSGDDAKIALDALHEQPCKVLNNKILFLEFLTHMQFARLADREPDTGQVLDASRGLHYVPDFITRDEEQRIMRDIGMDDESEIAGGKWFRVQRRMVKHYGYAFDYHIKHIGDASLTASPELPAWVRPLVARMHSHVAFQPDQLTIQRYAPGSGIAFHTDSHTAFTDTIVILSLGTPVHMDFRKPAQGDHITTLDLQPRSLVIMQGEARYGWEHAIRARRSDLVDGRVREREERWSLTLRTVSRSVQCSCQHSSLCDSNDAMDSNIKVIARFRPPNSLEKRSGGTSVIELEDETTVGLKCDEHTGSFTFDRVFGPDSSQPQIYNYAIRDTLEDVFNGYNGTVFCYGQTGSGKTFTMMGADIDNDSLKGITPRIVEGIFGQIIESPPTLEYMVKASYMEIYMERIRDLLNPDENNLPVHEDKANGVYVKGLMEVFVSSIDEVYQVMRQGAKNR